MRFPFAQAELAERVAVEAKATRRRRKGITAPSKGTIGLAFAEAERMREACDWSKASPRHIVALHAVLHEHVYEVEAAEASGKEFSLAALSVARMLKTEFDGSTEAMVDFLRWSWQREQGREQWRRDNGKEGGRLDWRRLFAGRGVLTDYRVDQARKAGRG